MDGGANATAIAHHLAVAVSASWGSEMIKPPIFIAVPHK
jgi:hypothetical protein